MVSGISVAMLLCGQRHRIPADISKTGVVTEDLVVEKSQFRGTSTRFEATSQIGTGLEVVGTKFKILPKVSDREIRVSIGRSQINLLPQSIRNPFRLPPMESGDDENAGNDAAD